MSRQSSAAAQNSEASPEIEVDLDQSDAGKAVNRHASPSAQDDEPLSTEEQQQSSWLQRNKAVQKRIGRMQRQFDQRLANEQAERQRERREFTDRIERLEAGRVATGDDKAHEAAVSAIESKIEAALEAGDSKLAARLNREMSELIAKHMQAKTTAHMQQAPREQNTQNTQAARRGATRADRFIEQTEWWDDPDHLAERSFANSLFAQFTEEGMDPEGDSIFKKINKRLKAKFPDLDVVDMTQTDKDDDETDEDDDSTTKATRRAPVQNFHDRGQEPSGGRGNKVRLSNEDIAMMKAMKMDPKNDRDCLAFVREKQAMAESER